MSKKKTLLQTLMDMPYDQVKLDPYYQEESKTIRVEVDDLLGFKTSDEQFNSLIYAWHCRDLLIGRCDQYNFTKLRNRIDSFIQQAEAILDEQQSIITDVNFLFPISGHAKTKGVIFLDSFELDRLRKIRDILSRSKGKRGDKKYLTKCAYFELFFIGELLGLPATSKPGETNNLITLAELMTSQTKPNRSMLSEHYQKYEHFKKMTPEVNSIIFDGKRRFANNPKFSSSLEKFQDDIYPNIPIPSPK